MNLYYQLCHSVKFTNPNGKEIKLHKNDVISQEILDFVMANYSLIHVRVIQVIKD